MVDRILEASVRETKESLFATEIVVDGHRLLGDQPVSEGGRNLGPNPHELLLSALGACTAMTVRWYASRHAIPLDSVSVDLTYRREMVDGKISDVFAKSVRLEGTALIPEIRTKLLDVAAKCPIQRLLEGTPIIRTVEQA